MAATIAMSPRGCGFEQSCNQCHDPEIRRRWGCDEPTVEPLFWIDPCPFCSGKLDDCEHCKGSNRVPMHRCPNQIATQREHDCISACALVEQGVLPDPGGWQDQSATFTQAYRLGMQEIAHWRSVARQKAAKGK